MSLHIPLARKRERDLGVRVFSRITVLKFITLTLPSPVCERREFVKNFGIYQKHLDDQLTPIVNNVIEPVTAQLHPAIE